MVKPCTALAVSLAFFLGAALSAQAQDQAAAEAKAADSAPSVRAPGYEPDARTAAFTSLLGMQLGVTTMTQVEQQIGAAKLNHTRASGNYLASLCYRAKSSAVQFISGEAGGANLKLLAFALRPLNALKDCAPLSRKLAVQKLEIGGLKLGMSKAAFTKTVGSEVKWHDDMGQVEFQDRRMLTDAEISKFPPEKQVAIASARTKNYFDVSIALIGTFSGDKLVMLEVWKTETL